MNPNLRNRWMTIPLAAAALLSAGLFWNRDAQSAPPAAAATPTAAETAPGLTVTFTTKDGKTDTRPARLLTLLVPANTPPTPFLSAGPFKATFDGYITQKLRGDFKFSASGNGKVKITVNDKPIFDATGELGAAEEKPASFKKGLNKVTVEYESPDQGDATLRVSWSSDDFPSEPIDPRLFSHAKDAKDLATGVKLREGQALFADLHCVRCHTDPSLADAAKNGGMPELAKDAPTFDEIGSRLNQKWIAHWVANPKSLRPDTSMPNVFHGKAGTTPQEAADVAAYLSTLTAKAADATPEPGNNAADGEKLVTQFGCVGCHTPPNVAPLPVDPHGRISWQNVKAKYQPKALVAFLKQPEKHYAWIRMPNFRLNDDEAKKIAAYLLTNSKDLDGDAPKGDAANGQKLIASAGCVSCHNLTGTQNQAKAADLAAIVKDTNKGCLAADDAGRGKAPDFGLTAEQREALTAFVSTDRAALKHDVPVEFAQRQIVELRCTSCHTRDAQLDIWDDLASRKAPLAEGAATNPEAAGAVAGAPPAANANAPAQANGGEPQPGTGDQQRPPLTWVGEKLHPEWMAKFIGGKLDYKPRVWMLARMPGFPARAEGLAAGLAMEHACPAKSPADEKPADEELAKSGKQLVSRNGGFSCVQCHGIGNIGPISPFEAPSINFKYTNERIRKEYYDRWMRDPTRVVPTTKMPKFQNDGKTALSDILDGDADKQFDAIWNYLMAGRKIEHPEQQ